MKEDKEIVKAALVMAPSQEKKLTRHDITTMCDKLKNALGGNPPLPMNFTHAIFIYDSVAGRLLKIEVTLVPVEER